MSESGTTKRTIGLLVVILAGLALAIAYNVKSSREKSQQPQSATVFDFNVDWRCLECGYTEHSKGSPEVRTCPKCNKQSMYISGVWTCPKHGPFQIAFTYDANGRPKDFKLPDGQWQPAFDAEGMWMLVCPKCQATLQPPARDLSTE